MESLRLFRGVRKYTVTEEVEVFAHHSDEARELIEDDNEDVKVLNEFNDSYEIYGQLTEIKI